MKQFIQKTTLLFCIIAGIVAALIILPPRNQESGYNEYMKKIGMVMNTPSKRIIFVSGSSLNTALDSQMMEDSLHINVVNYGLNAGIGLKFWLDDVTPYVRKGDIVVVAPEYPQFFNDVMYGNPETLGPLMYYSNMRNITKMNLKQLLNVIKGIPSIINSNVIGAIGKKRQAPQKHSGANPSEFKSEKTPSPLPPHQAENNFKPTWEYKRPLVVDEDFGNYFVQKINELKAQGATVLIVPSVIRATAFARERINAYAIDAFLRKHGLAYHSKPELHVVPDEDASDTDYHTNYYGRIRNTQVLINEIRPYIR